MSVAILKSQSSSLKMCIGRDFPSRKTNEIRVGLTPVLSIASRPVTKTTAPLRGDFTARRRHSLNCLVLPLSYVRVGIQSLSYH